MRQVDSLIVAPWPAMASQKRFDDRVLKMVWKDASGERQVDDVSNCGN